MRRLSWSLYLTRKLAEGRSQNLHDAEAIQVRQQSNVQRIVHFAYNTVSYYRETMRHRGLAPSDISAACDLAKLPILERTDLQRDPEYFVSRAVQPDRCLALKSSGSSGRPKIIWHDPAAVFHNAAHGERDRAMITRAIGRWTGYRETVIVSPIDASQRAVQEFVQSNSWFPGKLRIKRQYLFLSDPPQTNIEAMNEFRPDLLYAYGSYVEMLYRRFRRGDLHWHLPKAIVYSSDRLSPKIRTLITTELGVPVFSLYGAVEALKIGFECQEHNGYHLNSDFYPVRIVDNDGRDKTRGEVGQVVISNLLNRATVLLNYRIGDLAALTDESCPCGLALPLISPPVGRVDEVIELSNGDIVHPIALREICLRLPHILQYQVRQLAPDDFLVSLITDPQADHSRLEIEIKTGFQQRFGDSVRARVQFVQELDRNPAGKTTAVISFRPGSENRESLPCPPV